MLKPDKLSLLGEMDDPAATPIKPALFTPHFLEPENDFPTPRRQSGISKLSSTAASSNSEKDWTLKETSQDPSRKDSFAHSGSMSMGNLRTANGSDVKRTPSMPRKVRWYHIWSQRITNNKLFVAFTTTLTCYALLGDDFRLLCTDKPADLVFNILTLVCLTSFSFEVVVSCLGKDDYFLGFFFGLDVISTVTMVLDLTWVSDQLAQDEDDLEKARSGRTARMGAKVGRIVRVIRLVRIVKLYKAWHESRKKKAKAERRAQGDEEFDFDEEEDEKAGESGLRESVVGKKLSSLTTQRVIILVLALLLILPLLSVDDSTMSPSSPTYGADEVWEAFDNWRTGSSSRKSYERMMLKYTYYHNWFTGNYGCTLEDQGCSSQYMSNLFWMGIASKDEANFETLCPLAQIRASTVTEWETSIQQQDDAYNYGSMPSIAQNSLARPWDQSCKVGTLNLRGISLLAQSITDYNEYTVNCPNDLRLAERAKWNPRVMPFDSYNEWHIAFYFDVRPYVKAEAGFNIIITFFVCLVLCLASVFFSKDANTLVLEPVEKMISKVESIRDNPLIALKMADDEFRLEEKKKAAEDRDRKDKLLQFFRSVIECKSSDRGGAPMETVILDKTIIKLGTLLALGCGEAGSGIVSSIMGGSNQTGMNAMAGGVRVDCILGNAKIRDFSVATEVLQGKVMTFVNQIAEIVHGVVDEFGGAANKNNGETFILVWRCAGKSPEVVSKMADMAMLAFAKVLGAVHRSPLLSAYREHPALKQRLGNGCRVNLSFGLHYGWAIEGAVGSEFKIDASYLSPHVSIADSVEHATRVYDVSICATHLVAQLCTKGTGEAETPNEARDCDRRKDAPWSVGDIVRVPTDAGSMIKAFDTIPELCWDDCMNEMLGKQCEVKDVVKLAGKTCVALEVPPNAYNKDGSRLQAKCPCNTTAAGTRTWSYPVELLTRLSLAQDRKTNDMGQKLRLIDTVMIKGSKVPIHLYALDLDCMSLQVDVVKPRRFVWNLRQRYRARQLLEAEKNRKWSSKTSMAADFDASHDVQIMRRRYTEEFLETFKMGYQCYSEGEWECARNYLSAAQSLLGARDGPSVALLRLMEMYNFKSPEWWEGLHHFGEGYGDGGGGETSEPTSRRQSFGPTSPVKSRTMVINNSDCSTT